MLGRVKVFLGIVGLLLAVPVLAFGHAEIFFPKLFSRNELANTGFAFLNPDPVTATVTFVLLSRSGSPLSSLKDVQIGPGQQFARLGSELFPSASEGGWVYAINDTEGMQAFWLNYDEGITFLDGAEASQYETIGPDQIVPLVAGETELNIINPNSQKVTASVQLFGSTGPLGPAVTRELPTAGAFQTAMSSMFSLPRP
jgi:hypothetical protein